MGNFINIFVKLGVATVLIIAATTKQEYSYYTFIRWVVVTASIYFAYKAYHQKLTGLVIYFSAVALLFNPFIPFWFQRNTWQLIDYIIAAITLFTIYSDLATSSKP